LTHENKANPDARKLRVVGYVRVSTEEQAREGVSTSVQPEKIRAYAALHDLELVEVVVDDGVSGKSLDRPGLKKALRMLDSFEADGLIVAKLDRLTRSVADLGKLIADYFGGESGNCHLFSVADSIDTQTATGRMILNITATIAQWERETIVERTQDALDHKRAKGERLGQVPYGRELAEDGKTLRASREEAAIARIVKRHKAEGWSLRMIARKLEAGGCRTKKGGTKWSPSSVSRLIEAAGREVPTDATS
jgi:site-specific DNA recombinase